ncbi:MAG TPA: SLATT domain-containing protein [Vicinamibacterales bacterium]
MFQVTQLDLLRVGFAGAVHEYEGHLAAAQRLSTRLLQIQVGELVLMAAALGFSVTAFLRLDVKYVVASALFAGVALATFAIYVALNLPSRIYAHRWCASRLWLIRERYMELLSEVHDGVLTPEGIHARHDQLVREIHAVVEHAPMLDRATYSMARQTASSGKPLTDNEINAILPPSLHKPA